MIYLITGVPGSGKTLKMMSDLMNRKDLQGRPVFLDGVPEVDEKIIPHFKVPDGESMQTWHNWAPTGAILVIDECQRVFRPRPSGSKVPEHVSELETHRHKGIDIFLLTQHPRLIDANVRNLIGHHCHISKTNLGLRRMVEWNACGDPQSRQSIAEGVKSVYTLDKRAFGVYKSAEEHTKIRTKLSRAVYVFPAVLLAIIIGAYYAYGSWNKINEKKPRIAQSQAVATATTNVPQVQAAAATQNAPETKPTPSPEEQAKAQKAAYLTADDFTPRIQGQAYTAPIYDGMNRAVKTMPYPVGCVKSGNSCTCYTEQATPIKDLPKLQCLDYVENGIYNPYKAAAPEAAQAAGIPQNAGGAQVLAMSGESPDMLKHDAGAAKQFDVAGGGVVNGGVPAF